MGFGFATGLGLYEYMQLAEELGAEPVWVINNGVAHADSVPTADIQPWVQVPAFMFERYGFLLTMS